MRENSFLSFSYSWTHLGTLCVCRNICIFIVWEYIFFPPHSLLCKWPKQLVKLIHCIHWAIQENNWESDSVQRAEKFTNPQTLQWKKQNTCVWFLMVVVMLVFLGKWNESVLHKCGTNTTGQPWASQGTSSLCHYWKLTFSNMQHHNPSVLFCFVLMTLLACPEHTINLSILSEDE